ncbi:MAG: alpha-E domain-containing protein, partial [Microthrixaceae bacterium]
VGRHRLMLARTAEQLFWAGRYLERAEHTARLMDVTYHRLLEATPVEQAEAWRDVLGCVSQAKAFAERCRPVSGREVSAFLVADTDNPGSIASSVAQARSNARGVREQLPAEWWEVLNSFSLELAARNLQRELDSQPSDLYRFVRRGVLSVLGVADGTWTRDEGWLFFMLGVHLERAEMTARTLRVRFPRHRADEVHEWFATLRVASALSTYRRRYRDYDRRSLVDLLLLSGDVPRSVLFSMRHAESILRSVVDPEGSLSVRLTGRSRAELEFADADELMAAGNIIEVLQLVEEQIRAISNSVAAECFLSHAELDLQSLHVLPGAVPFTPEADHDPAQAGS